MNESALAHKYLDGMKGVEIGGASHNAFGLDTVNVDIELDSLSSKKSIEYGFKPMPVDFIANGDDLPFDDKSYDFVISSHVIEHFYDPIAALKEWERVARLYVVLIVPHKERTFDKDRDITCYKELLIRHEEPEESKDKSIRHHCVWNTESFLELCKAIDLNVIEYQDVDDRIGNGFGVVIKI